MPKGPPLEFMSAHGIDSDEVWEVRPGIFAVKHSALERAAMKNKIRFDLPTVIEAHSVDKVAVLCVNGHMGDNSEWSIGEASPANNKNAYAFAMAEKRAKDRVILKLLNAHGALYSDAEADDFAQEGKKSQLPKKDAKEIYSKMQREIQECQSRDQLKEWMQANTDRIAVLPDDWRDILRLQCEEMLADLREREK